MLTTLLLLSAAAAPHVSSATYEQAEQCRTRCAVDASRCGQADCPTPASVRCGANDGSPACQLWRKYDACVTQCDGELLRQLHEQERWEPARTLDAKLQVVQGQLEVEGHRAAQPTPAPPCRFWKDAEACRTSCTAGALRSCPHAVTLLASEAQGQALLTSQCARGDVVSCAALTTHEPTGVSERRLRTLALGVDGCRAQNGHACLGAALVARQTPELRYHLAAMAQQGCTLGEPQACVLAVQQLREDYPTSPAYLRDWQQRFYDAAAQRCAQGDTWACWQHARARAGWAPWTSGLEDRHEWELSNAVTEFQALCDQGHRDACGQVEATRRDLASAQERRRQDELRAEQERQRQEQERQRQEDEARRRDELDREERLRWQREDEQRREAAERQAADDRAEERRHQQQLAQQRQDSAQAWSNALSQAQADSQRVLQQQRDQFAATQRALDAARQREDAERQRRAEELRQRQEEQRRRQDELNQTRRDAEARLEEQRTRKQQAEDARREAQRRQEEERREAEARRRVEEERQREEARQRAAALEADRRARTLATQKAEEESRLAKLAQQKAERQEAERRAKEQLDATRAEQQRKAREIKTEPFRLVVGDSLTLNGLVLSWRIGPLGGDCAIGNSEPGHNYSIVAVLENRSGVRKRGTLAGTYVVHTGGTLMGSVHRPPAGLHWVDPGGRTEVAGELTCVTGGPTTFYGNFTVAE